MTALAPQSALAERGSAVAFVGTAGLVAAACVDNRALSTAIAGATVVVVAVIVATARQVGRGVSAILLVPAVVLVTVGVPATALISHAASSSVFPARRSAATGSLPTDLSARFAAALDQADRMTPSGSDSVLSVDVTPSEPIQVQVLDSSTGEALSSSSLDEGGWTPVTRAPTTSRRAEAFTRHDVAGLNLTATAARIAASATAMGVPRDDAAGDGSVQVARRPEDHKLVATFQIGSADLEADQTGALPGTAPLATLPGLLPAITTLLRDNGFNPATVGLDEVQYMALRSGAQSIGASPIEIGGGVDIEVDGPGRTGDIVEVPGRFPDVTLRPTSSQRSGFTLSSVTAAVLDRIRTDVIARHGVDAVDRDAVALDIGQAPADSPDGPMTIRMRVGPESDAAGVYRFDGAYVRAGTW